jgi:hypothetical protein
MRILVGSLVVLCCISCSPASEQHREVQGQRERDSVLGASRLPGAGGVRGALRVADSAAARRQLEDSVAATPPDEP